MLKKINDTVLMALDKIINTIASGVRSVASYILNCLIAVDQLFNVIMGPVFNLIFSVKKSGYYREASFGHPDETISSVLGKLSRMGNKRARRVCRLLHVLDDKHCYKSIEENVNK